MTSRLQIRASTCDSRSSGFRSSGLRFQIRRRVPDEARQGGESGGSAAQEVEEQEREGGRRGDSDDRRDRGGETRVRQIRRVRERRKGGEERAGEVGVRRTFCERAAQAQAPHEDQDSAEVGDHMNIF
ncbi:hypothetical protein U1Q18_010759, partial [Sarracenia purpurea var. burkii]